MIFGAAYISWHKDPHCFFTMSFYWVFPKNDTILYKEFRALE